MFLQIPPYDGDEDRTPEAYTDFVAALERLIDGTPTDPRLIELLESNGHVPITQANVASEAQRDRKAISGKACRYPRLAAFIKSLRGTHGVTPSTTALIQRLQAEAREWRHREKVLCSKIAEKTIELHDARRELERLSKSLAA